MVKNSKNPKYLTGFIIVSFLVLTLFLTVRLTLQKQDLQIGASRGSKERVRLLLDDSSIRDTTETRAVVLDFSQVSCCKVLSNEYSRSAGVVFKNNQNAGWATYQANGFANHLSRAPISPGAPAGITGTSFTLSKATRKVGMYIQAGSPFDSNSKRPAKIITLKVFDANGTKLFERKIDTCLSGGTGSTGSPTCEPKFIGVKSGSPIIKRLRVVINDNYNWSIDNLKWEEYMSDLH
jgi:hypothetical protein